MGKVERISYLVVVLAMGCEDFEAEQPCEDRAAQASVDEPLDELGGETAAQRFDRAAAPRACSVGWFQIPPQLGASEPMGSSALELLLERTGDSARLREYSLTQREKYDSLQCPPVAVFVPCLLTLQSEDGGLDEVLDCELRLQGENTLLNEQLGAYDFTGTHAVTFTGDVPPDTVEVNLVFSPGVDPVNVVGGIAESANLPGTDPFLTTAAIECTSL